jgi:transcriptional regulator GlxA family with amidase domain
VTKTFGILLFPEAEELDFVGPWEVFTNFAKFFDKDWQTLLVAQTREPVRAAKGMLFTPDCAFDDCPALDVLLIPGGQGTRREVDNEALVEFVRRVGQGAAWVTSVCTGAFILRRAGFLTGRRATTHWAALDLLRAEPDVTVVEQRFVHDGNVITAAGVSAGIDMALYLAGLLASPEVARNVQKVIEYYPEPPYAEEEAMAAGKEAS